MGAFPCVVLAENCAAGSFAIATVGAGVDVGVGVLVGVGVGVGAGVVVPAGVRVKYTLLVSLMSDWLMLWTQTV
jgi:hypothetical protein